MNKKQWLGLGLVTVAAIGLAACGNRASKKDSANSESKTDLKAAIVTDTGGVDDKSFNNLLGKVCKLGGKKTVFLKGTDLTTSNQQMNLNMRQTLMKLFLTTTN